MEAAEQSFQRDLQHVKFCDMKLHATIWSGSEGAYKLNWERKILWMVPCSLSRSLLG
jgi:hypothetical protein